ncbi:MAG: hypothetical protein AUG44_13535 [Actinobacteria bacterium 13_1_20CM_3_71_11]|nr:MAG: hypothetical protein AUG44_13535 [Actinobacteria bacterium 13_1_20CM_3_71_11]
MGAVADQGGTQAPGAYLLEHRYRLGAQPGVSEHGGDPGREYGRELGAGRAYPDGLGDVPQRLAGRAVPAAGPLDEGAVEGRRELSRVAAQPAGQVDVRAASGYGLGEGAEEVEQHRVVQGHGVYRHPGSGE